MERSGRQREGRSLLDGEEFDDDERNMSNMHGSYPSVSYTPGLLKSRTAETGSIFREEVWPPPGFVDPIAKQSSQVDLSGIVDDVMGPSMSSKPGHKPSLSDSSSSTFIPSYPEPSASPYELRQPTDASTVSAYSVASTSSSSLITDKVYGESLRSNSGASTSRPTSLSYTIPAPVTPGTSNTISYPVAAVTSPIPVLPPSPRGSSNTQPKNSSPLARSLPNDSQLWLNRSPNRSEFTPR